MDEVIQITKDIKAGKIKPIYFFMGEEPYYIDKLTDFIQENILQEHERDFNQTIIYGRDTTIEEVVSNAKRYPMMADRQVVIVREAQELSRYIDKLEAYVENPQPTTVLVFAYKYKTLDRRKKITKLLDKVGVVYESKKLYENQVGEWIKRVLSGQGYSIEPKASSILVEFLGTDLSKISNELDKLKIILPKGHTISPKDIEENIGFSKDFNNFELRSALGEKNQLKSYQIVDYFAQNPKDNPMVVTTAMVFGFFSQLMQYHGLKDKSKQNVSKELKINAFFVKDYEVAARNYPMRKVSGIIGALRDIDVKSKGVGAASMTHHDLLKEMLINIFY
ncbi:DNA polymerase III subunit delta [Flavobacterium ardleyense]|uniref:DNA polymerase III subunit delta n=1 Tax=Flavobacterium ardleyense TaxID=2038737 RepID=A0ABW5Z5U0_9FLAO